MDALPPPHLPDHGAYVAPQTVPDGGGSASAAPRIEPPRAQLFTARFGLGVGTAGSDGFAGTYFGQLDFWPLKFVGVGVEGEACGSDSPGIFRPSPTVSYHAMRVRAGLRVPFPLRSRAGASNPQPKLLVLSAGVGVGRGSANRTTYSPAPCDENYGSCDTIGFFSDADYVANEKRTDRTTVSVELALRVQWRVAEVGVGTRYQTWDGAALLTFGPTFGVGF